MRSPEGPLGGCDWVDGFEGAASGKGVLAVAFESLAFVKGFPVFLVSFCAKYCLLLISKSLS